ncbi:MAG TPA: DUF983 domain-containing protein [Thermomicrobiales bacterium]|nr:DUF983 domain-containing protein [Thermomicrobiales bacterium]
MVETQVSKLTILLRGLTKRCPRCGEHDLFRRWTEMVDACPRCGLHFEQEDGYWVGALTVNTIVSMVLFGLVISLTVALTWPDIPVYETMLFGSIAGIAFPYFYYPFSKTNWVAIDLAFFHPELMQPGTGLHPRR